MARAARRGDRFGRHLGAGSGDLAPLRPRLPQGTALLPRAPAPEGIVHSRNRLRVGVTALRYLSVSLEETKDEGVAPSPFQEVA